MDFSSLSALPPERLAKMSPACLMWAQSRDSMTPWIPYRHHVLIDHELRKVAAGKTKFLIVSAPVQHGKSQIGSIGFATWYLGTFPDRHVAVLSHTQGFAADNIGRPTRALFERIGKPYFGQSIDPRSDASNRWNILGRAGGFFCDGVDGRIEGRRIDLAILDDLIGSAADAESARSRDALWQWWLSIYPRFSPETGIVVLISRWHQDDFVGRLIAAGERGDIPNPKVLDLPAIALEPEEYAEGADPLGRAPGEALWPEIRGRDFLEATRKAIGSRVFAARFQGRPQAASGTVFQRSLFRYFDTQPSRIRLFGANGDLIAQYPHADMRTFQMVDLASTIGGGDYFVIGTFSVTPKFELLVRDIYRAQIGGADQLAVLSQQRARWNAKRIGIESVGYQSAFVAQAVAAGLPAAPIKRGRESKEMRAYTAQARMESGSVFFDRNGAWLGEFEAELLDFPRGKHDDQVDVLSDAATALLDLTTPKDVQYVRIA